MTAENVSIGTEDHRCLLVHTYGVQLFAVYFPQREAKRPFFEFLLGLPPKYLLDVTLIAGDFNTGKHLEDEAGATFDCADSFEGLTSAGWVDVWRAQHGEKRAFSWYSRTGNGFRIDHVLA